MATVEFLEYFAKKHRVYFRIGFGYVQGGKIRDYVIRDDGSKVDFWIGDNKYEIYLDDGDVYSDGWRVEWPMKRQWFDNHDSFTDSERETLWRIRIKKHIGFIPRNTRMLVACCVEIGYSKREWFVAILMRFKWYDWVEFVDAFYKDKLSKKVIKDAIEMRGVNFVQVAKCNGKLMRYVERVMSGAGCLEMVEDVVKVGDKECLRGYLGELWRRYGPKLPVELLDMYFEPGVGVGWERDLSEMKKREEEYNKLL